MKKKLVVCTFLYFITVNIFAINIQQHKMNAGTPLAAVNSAITKPTAATDDQLLQQKIAYKKNDLVFWSPIAEKHIADGMSVFELCAAAMMYSDNTATNLIVKKLGSPKIVTDFARSIGDKEFRIDGWEPNLNSDPTHLEDTSTPAAMSKSMQRLTLGNVLPPQHRDQLVSWMKGNTTGDTRIRAGVPKGWNSSYGCLCSQ